MYMAYVKSKRMGSKKRRVRKTRRIKGGSSEEQASEGEKREDMTQPTKEEALAILNEINSKVNKVIAFMNTV
jgi:hypothetical protein